MKFDVWTVVLLRRPDDRPELDAAASDALQDAHMAYLTRLHEEGHLVAAGPVQGTPNAKIAGVCLYRVGLEETRALAENDPAVTAGLLHVETFTWSVPNGAIRSGSSKFPRSMADVVDPS